MRFSLFTICLLIFGLAYTRPLMAQENKTAPAPPVATQAHKLDVKSNSDDSSGTPQSAPAVQKKMPVDNSDEVEVEFEDSDESGQATTDDVTVDATGGVGAVNFSGRLKERGTRRPLANLTVYLKDTEYETLSDEDGNFSFPQLPPASYRIVIPSTSHETFKTEEQIEKERATVVTYYLDSKIYGGLEVVVRGKKVRKEVSKKVLTMQEAQVIPGSNGDAVKVVQNLPGVARGGTSSDGVVMRGSNAEDSRILLDGHEIPLLFHFGGVKSIYNSELLDEVNLYTGGFGAQWGDATGGIVELETSDPRTDRWGGYVDLSLIDASALAEGPINEDMGLALALRRSTVDIWLPAVFSGNEDMSFTTYPAYYDYQAKWTAKLGKGHSVSLDAYGSIDMLKLTMDTVGDEEPDLTGNLGMSMMFHSAFMHYRFKNDIIESDFSPGYTFLKNDIDLGDNFFLNSMAHMVDVNEDVRVALNDKNSLRFGLQLKPRFIEIDANIIRPPKEGDVETSFANDESYRMDTNATDLVGGAYVTGDLKLGPVDLLPGLRFDYESEINEYTLSPRLGINYHVIKALTLKAAGGMYSRIPDEDEIMEPWGTDDLVLEKSVHAVAGVEWNITDVISLEAQGYYKYLYDLVNATDKQEGEYAKPYDNSAKGYVYGGEIMLRHNWTDKFFGWISYSVSRSMRNDGPGTPYRLFDMDQTHNLVAVASWQFAKGWRLGGRFQFTSGEPYTDIMGSVLNADNGTYMPLYDPEGNNAKRTAPYHRLDLRLDKQWVFDTWMLNTYLDVQGVYYHANEIGTVYNYDYSERGAFKELPILPSIGIKAEF